jgi:hypothetical protein
MILGRILHQRREQSSKQQRESTQGRMDRIQKINGMNKDKVGFKKDPHFRDSV